MSGVACGRSTAGQWQRECRSRGCYRSHSSMANFPHRIPRSKAARRPPAPPGDRARAADRPPTADTGVRRYTGPGGAGRAAGKIHARAARHGGRRARAGGGRRCGRRCGPDYGAHGAVTTQRCDVSANIAGSPYHRNGQYSFRPDTENRYAAPLAVVPICPPARPTPARQVAQAGTTGGGTPDERPAAGLRRGRRPAVDGDRRGRADAPADAPVAAAVIATRAGRGGSARGRGPARPRWR